MSLPLRRTRTAALLSALAVAVTTVLLPTPATADTRPPAGIPATVSTDPLPTVQINGIVWTQVIIGNTVYAGGRFTAARPAGAPAGSQQVARSNLLAYNVTNGALLGFAPTFNGDINHLSASPDGSRLYVGGAFTRVNGQVRNRVASFDTATGNLNGFAPSANSTVQAIAQYGNTVYLGGNFTAIGSSARTRLAAVNATTGAVLPGFAPRADGGRVRGIAVSPNGDRIVAAGSFTTLNGSGSPGYGMGAVWTSNGSNARWDVALRVRNAGTNSAVYSLTSDGDSVYGTGYHYGSGGNLEGAFRASWNNGTLVWVEDCHGDTYSGAITGNTFYIAGHPHYCGTSGGFPQTDPQPNWTYQRGMAWSKQQSGRVANNQTLGYASWAGTPIPHLLNWWPDFNTGTVSGSNQGPWSVAASANYVVYGGEFTRVNNQPQQGLVRFAVSSIAPNRDGPRLGGNSFPISANSPAANQVRVSFRANYDRDNEFLTYQILRNGVAVGGTQTVASRIWYQRPNVTMTATVSGGSASYQVRARDPFGNTQVSAAVTVGVGGGAIAQAAPGEETPPPDTGTDPGGTPPAPTTAGDDFNRTVSGGWGTATSGGSWTLSSAPSTYSVSQNGRLSLSAGQSAEAYLTAVSGTSSNVTAQFGLSALPAGGTAEASVLGRSNPGGDYRAVAVVDGAGAVTLQLRQNGTVLASSPIAGLTVSAMAALQIRLQVTGTDPTTIQARIWRAGTTEPTTWQVSATSTAPGLQSAGHSGLGGAVSGGVTNGVIVGFDNYALTTQ